VSQQRLEPDSIMDAAPRNRASTFNHYETKDLRRNSQCVEERCQAGLSTKDTCDPLRGEPNHASNLVPPLILSPPLRGLEGLIARDTLALPQVSYFDDGFNVLDISPSLQRHYSAPPKKQRAINQEMLPSEFRQGLSKINESPNDEDLLD
jgi:hypothetical protein